VPHTHTHARTHTQTHTHTHTQGWYQKKHSSTHTHPDHRTYPINFLHPPRSTASPVCKPRARQSLSTTPTWIDVGRFPASLGRGYPRPSPHYTMICHLYHLYLIGTTRGKAMSIEDAFRNFYRFFLFILLHCLCQYPVIAN